MKKLFVLLILGVATFNMAKKEKENLAEIIGIVKSERAVLTNIEKKLVGNMKIIKEIDIES